MSPIRRNIHDAATISDHLRGFLHREVGAFGIQREDLVELLLRRFH